MLWLRQYNLEAKKREEDLTVDLSSSISRTVISAFAFFMFVLLFTSGSRAVFLFFNCLCAARLSTLRRVRDDVQGVSAGTECGLSVTDEKFTFEQGDRIEAFEIKVTRSPVKWEF